MLTLSTVLLGFGMFACGDGDAEAVWSETSESLEIRCNNYWEGKITIIADRAQLTSAQAEALAMLQAQPAGPATECGADGDQDFCDIRITATSGQTKNYRAEETAGCGTVPYDLLKPVLHAFGCVRSGGESHQMPTGTHASSTCR